MERKVLILKGNGSPLIAKPVGRNVKCRCGSGKKSKNCCGAETEYYHSNKNINKEKYQNNNNEYTKN